MAASTQNAEEGNIVWRQALALHLLQAIQSFLASALLRITRY
jgi:hypothetical protein